MGCEQADEAARRYEEQSQAESSGQQATPRFEAKDLESLSGSYNTVCCIDVLIHYPPVLPLALHPFSVHCSCPCCYVISLLLKSSGRIGLLCQA